MDFFDCITNRHSCRAFLPKPVPKEIVQKILRAANHSPSYMNSQPWEVMVVTGEKLKSLAQLLHEKALAREAATPDLAFPATWPDYQGCRLNII